MWKRMKICVVRNLFEFKNLIGKNTIHMKSMIELKYFSQLTVANRFLFYKITIVHLFFSCLVIYDDDLTDILFNVFIKLFQEKTKLHSIYITIEKRINFYLETLSVQCPAYEYFLEKLDQLKSILPMLNMESIDTDQNSVRQCTSIYERTKELVK